MPYKEMLFLSLPGGGGLDQYQLTGRYVESEGPTPQPTISQSSGRTSLAQYAPVQQHPPQLKPPSCTPARTSALLVPCPTGPGFTKALKGFSSRNQAASFLLTHSHRNIFLISE